MEKKTRNNTARKQMAEFIVEGYKQGATLTELAKTHNCSAGTIANILHDNGLKARRRGPKTKKENTNGTVEQTMQSNTI